MEWIISAAWVLGAAFGMGWSHGEREEEGLLASTAESITGMWLAWPAYQLGRVCGRRYTARRLAPERMKAKLLEEQKQPTYRYGSQTYTVRVPPQAFKEWSAITTDSTNTP